MDSIPPDATTIEALLRERAWVARLARGLARDPHAADDLEQESWLDTLLRPPRHTANLRSWLAQRVRHTFQSGARGDARRVQREALAARQDAESETQAAVERAELAREMVEIVLKLEEPYRSALVLVYLEGLTPGEVARRQGLPASTVRTHVQRGLERVRAELAHRRDDWRSALGALALVEHSRSATFLFLTAGGVAKALGVAAALVVAILALRAWQGSSPEPSPLAHAGPSVALVNDDASHASELGPAADRAVVASAAVVESQQGPGLRIRAVRERDGSPLADAALRVRRNDDAGRARRWYLRTDAEGRAELASPPLGKVMVDSDRGGWVNGIVDPIEGLDLELRVDDRIVIRGRVLDRRGSAVQGASVRASWNSNPEEDVEVAISDARGLFAFTCDDGRRAVGAWHADYGASPRADLRHDVQTGTRDIELRLGGPGATLSVRVLDPDGTPAADATVRTLAESGPPYDSSLADGTRALPAGAWLGRCDADGRVRIQGLPVGPLRVLAWADGGPSSSAQVALEVGASAEIELILSQGASLRGVVRDAAGALVGGALVRIGEPHPQTPYHLMGEWEAYKDTDSDGAFRFDGLQPGARRILVDGRARGRVSADRVLVGGAETTCDLVVDAGRTLRGRLVDRMGAPLEGWRVHVEIVKPRRMTDDQLRETMGWPEEWRDARTDARGEFTFANQLAYELALTVMGPDPRDRTQRLARKGVRAGEEPVELVVDMEASSGWIVGRVLDPAGVPAAAVVRVVRDDEGSAREIFPFQADPITGRFRAGPLLSGVYRVTAQAAGWPPLRLDPVGVGTAEKDLGDVRLREPGSLRVRVRAPGVPEQELRVSMSGPSDSHTVAVVEGGASIDGLAPGTWRLQLVRNGTPSRSTRSPVRVEVEANGTTDVELFADPP